MSDGKEAGSVATPDKSPNTEQTFNERFNAQLEAWRTEGCPFVPEKDGGPTDAGERCGARPHRVKMLPPDESGNVTMAVDCANGHEQVWKHTVPKDQIEASMKSQSEAAAKAGRDPMVATLKISMNMRTQAVSIEPFVPTPGLGIQLAGMLMSHFFAELQANISTQPPAGGIITPGPKKLLDRNGKPLMS